jgi:hypothetical protein
VNYWLHPEAQKDLWEAAEVYRGQAGTSLSQSFLAEFERSVGLLLQHPGLGTIGVMENVVSSRDVSRLASSTPPLVIKSASSQSHTIAGALAIGQQKSSMAAKCPTVVRADARKREWFSCNGVAVRAASRAPLNILFRQRRTRGVSSLLGKDEPHA